MSSVEDLFATLGLRVKESEWATGDAVIDRARKQMLRTQVQAQQRSDKAQQSASRAVQSLLRQETLEARVAARAAQTKQRLDDRQAAQAARGRAREAKDKERATARSQRETERAAQAELQSWQRATALREKHTEKVAAGRRQFAQRVGQQAQTAALVTGGLAGFFGQRAIRSGIEHNSTMESSKDQIAGMLSLAKKTHLVDELKNADGLVENLSRRAAALPGTTEEYVRMLGMITKPIMDAKLSMKDLEDLTVNAVVAAKGFGIPADVAARDVGQALRGQYHSVDPFSSAILSSVGYEGEAGRRKYNTMAASKRASEFKRGLMQPQFAEMGEAQGKSFKGVMSTLQDAWERFMGAVTKPLFEQLVVVVKEMNAWLDSNKKLVTELAAVIGGALVVAFQILAESIKFLADHGDIVIAILVTISALWTAIAIKSIIAMLPLYLIAAAVGLVAYGIVKLVKHWDDVKDAAAAAWKAIKDGLSAAFNYVWDSAPVRALRALVDAVGRLLGIGSTDKTTAAAAVRNMENSGLIPKRKDATEAEQKLVESGALPRSAFRLPSAAGIPGAAGNSLQINGGVNVTVAAPNADAGMVANAVGKHFDDKMGNMLRRTMDVVK